MTVLYTENNPASQILVRKFGDAEMSLKLVLIAPFIVCQLKFHNRALLHL